MKIETLSIDFTDEQKRYLEGFSTGLQIGRVGKGLGGASAKANAEPTGPDAPHIKAQDRTIASGKKLVEQEKWKREEHPARRLSAAARSGRDRCAAFAGRQFRWRYYGIFYVGPTQDSYMCRLRSRTAS